MTVLEAEAQASHDPLDRAFARITGGERVAGNAVRVLRDAEENYPAWQEAIAGAGTTIHFENYIIADDAIGRAFADLLIERARAGVRVRLMYDWFGSLWRARRSFWARLAAEGVEVRAFNPPDLRAPLDVVRRNHRKVITVDGRIGFVSGLCVADSWTGDPRRNIEPWRDTGIELHGPAVADLDHAFAETWAVAGARLPGEELVPRRDIPPAGPVLARIVKGRPGQLSVYRLDQLVAAAARETLWLTDAYFVANNAYVRALVEAARDGVDVRLLVPGSSDVPLVQGLTRVGYRPLIEAGVRVFEWNGSMLHAKSAVADGSWARIGSSNLNLTSWMTNWELDVTIEDREVAAELEAQYEEDLAHATEIVLSERHRVRRAAAGPLPHPRRKGSGSRVAAGAIGLGSTVGAAITGSRLLSATEAPHVATVGAALLALGALAWLFPRAVIWPLVAILAWRGVTLLLRAWRLRRGG
jgi:cardiolipin synthase A/B